MSLTGQSSGKATLGDVAEAWENQYSEVRRECPHLTKEQAALIACDEVSSEFGLDPADLDWIEAYALEQAVGEPDSFRSLGLSQGDFL